MANLVVSAVSTWDNSGLKKGEKSLSAFDKSINRVAKSLALTFGATALLRFSKNAVKAFMADEAAAKSLATQLKNLGYEFATSNIEDYIAKLEKSTGVLDDHLRPAFQTLLTTTGLVTESQKALQVALDTSAATGMSLESVSSALAAGYRGQTKALKSLGVNLSKTALTAGNMSVALKEIGTAYSGQALARLDTYAGKMDVLEGAASRATETIGKGLLDSLALLSKDDSIQGAADDMEYFAKKVADATYGMALLLAKTDKFTGLDKVSTDTLFALSNPLLAALSSFGSSNRPNTGRANRTYQGGQTSNTNYILRKKEADAIKKANAARAAELALLNKKTAVEKLKDQFDLERIGLTAALNAATDEETKLRLKAQLAILDNNEALAKKLLAEMNAVKAVDELASAMNTAAKSILTAGQMVLLGLGVDPGQMKGSAITGTGGFPDISNLANSSFNNPNFGTSAEAMGLGLALGFTPGGGSNAPQEIVITVDTASTGDRLSQAIAESIQIATKNGFSTVPAGQGF